MINKENTKNQGTFLGIQVLRGLAACMVVIHHSSQMCSSEVSKGSPLPVWWTGAAGVDIFFVISGFVMAVSTIGREHKSHPARSFLERRLIRIVPLYWIVSAAFLLKLALVRWHPQLGGTGSQVRLTPAFIVTSFLLIPFRNSLGLIQPILNVGWTLSYEMFFYILFSIALALRVRVVYLLTPVMLVFGIVGLFRGPHWPAILVLLDPLLWEFLAGLLLGYFVIKGFRINATISAMLGLLGLFLFLVVPKPDMDLSRVLQWGIPAALLVLSVVMLEGRFGNSWPRWALFLGDASYSLYLVHTLVILALVRVMLKLKVLTPETAPMQREVAAVSIMICACILTALLLYQFVEKPMNLKLRRLLLAERLPRVG